MLGTQVRVRLRATYSESYMQNVVGKCIFLEKESFFVCVEGGEGGQPKGFDLKMLNHRH